MWGARICNTIALVNVVVFLSILNHNYLQGISNWNGTYELALTDKNIQVKIGLNMDLECWDREFLDTTTIFQKHLISWPQQPPTEKALNFNMIFHDSSPKKVFSKHQNKDEFNNLDDSEVLRSDFSGPRTSAASLTSSASVTLLASTASKALFHQKNFLILIVGTSLAQKWPILAPICEMDYLKSNFLLISDTLSVGGCWGQPMLVFLKRLVLYPKIPYLSIPEPSWNQI